MKRTSQFHTTEAAEPPLAELSVSVTIVVRKITSQNIKNFLAALLHFGEFQREGVDYHLNYEWVVPRSSSWSLRV